VQKPSRTVTRKCLSCDRSFRPARRDACYCSAACRQKAHRARSATDDLDLEIEATRLRYWDLVYEKARALGRRPSEQNTLESQYVDLQGFVWMLAPDGTRRLAGKLTPQRDGWESWGLEAAGPPWAPPTCGGEALDGFYESAILGKQDKSKRKVRSKGNSRRARA
jgi:hypothetical protein